MGLVLCAGGAQPLWASNGQDLVMARSWCRHAVGGARGNREASIVWVRPGRLQHRRAGAPCALGWRDTNGDGAISQSSPRGYPRSLTGAYCQWARWGPGDTANKVVSFTIKDAYGSCLPCEFVAIIRDTLDTPEHDMTAALTMLISAAGTATRACCGKHPGMRCSVSAGIARPRLCVCECAAFALL